MAYRPALVTVSSRNTSLVPGWVEHDPEEIWRAVAATLTDLLTTLAEPVAAIGIANQRETVVLWDRRTGEPRHRAIVWQDRRGAPSARRSMKPVTWS